MSEGPTRDRRVFWGSVGLATILAAGLSLLILRDGMAITPDGWAYWQGSVRLLLDGQYHYFHQDQPIHCWPPGYSMYLALWQKVLGVSGTTLIVCNVVLIALAAGLWTMLCLSNLRPLIQQCRARYPVAIAVYLATFFAVWLRSVLATNLLYVALPSFLLLAILARNQRSLGLFLLLTGATAISATVMLLAHNSSLAFLPIGGCLLLTNRSCTARWRWMAVICMAAIAMVPWYGVRLALGQTGSHSIGWGMARYTPIVYVWQLLYGIGYLLGAKPGLILLPGIVVLLAVGYRQARQSQKWAVCGSITAFATATAIAAGMMFALFNLTYIQDGLLGRFTLFVPALIVPLAIATWGWLRTRQPKTKQRVLNYAGLCLLMILAIAMQRTVKRTCRTPFDPQLLSSAPVNFVHHSHTIHPDHLDRQPLNSDSGVLAAPPHYQFTKGGRTGPSYRTSRAVPGASSNTPSAPRAP